jgi:hypothetical protein
MKKYILVILCLGILVILPNLALADCVDLAGYSRYVLMGVNTVIFYAGGAPYAKFDVQCPVESTSQILLLKSPVCDGDDVLVDGSKCTVLNVTSSM